MKYIILAIILCVTVVAPVIIGYICLCVTETKTELEKKPPIEHINHTKMGGEKAFGQQEELNKYKKEAFEKSIISYLIEKINNHFSFNYILYHNTLYRWINRILHNKEEVDKIIIILCKELSMDYGISPKGEYYYYIKNKKE